MKIIARVCPNCFEDIVQMNDGIWKCTNEKCDFKSVGW